MQPAGWPSPHRNSVAHFPRQIPRVSNAEYHAFPEPPIGTRRPTVRTRSLVAVPQFRAHLLGEGGADTMIGGIGSDEYVVDNAGDVVIENAGEGIDKVWSSINYTLGDHVENLSLSSGATNGTGNGLDNEIWGNSGWNNLNGGAGADTMYGMAGDDHYYVDNVGDQVIEFEIAGDVDWGIDWVWLSVDFTLGANVEKLFLLAGGEMDATGNTLGSEINGNNSANVLDGKSGADTVLGAGGNDTLRYWDGGGVDQLDGGADNGTVDFSGFNKAVYVELGSGAVDAWSTGTTDATGGAPLTSIANLGNIENIVGTNYNDTLIGDAVANRIAGGFGSDVLTGNDGQDTFVFSAALVGFHVDQVTDFSVADDTFHLDSFVFSALSDGALAAAAFHVGGTAADADDRIVLQFRRRRAVL